MQDLDDTIDRLMMERSAPSARQREAVAVMAESADLYGGDQLDLAADGSTLCCGCEDVDYDRRNLRMVCAACGTPVEVLG